MLQSMTGFGSASFKIDELEIEIEIKTLNSKYLDSKVLLPNVISGYELELNKLLVPSPSEEVFNVDGDLVAYRQPDVGFLQGIFNSFNDAPDGFSEELKELTYSLGFEYSFNKSFFLRSGYFSEHELKGSRKFITIGTGFNTDRNLKIDLSYLISTSDVISPLENTLRLSLGFNF